jgi:hypothetical protein
MRVGLVLRWYICYLLDMFEYKLVVKRKVAILHFEAVQGSNKGKIMKIVLEKDKGRRRCLLDYIAVFISKSVKIYRLQSGLIIFLRSIDTTFHQANYN